MIEPDWVIAISSVVSLCVIFFLYIQNQLLLKQYKEDHERSRREKAVEMIIKWTELLRKETSSTRKLIESLDSNQASNLFNEKIINISRDLKMLVHSSLGDEIFFKETGSMIEINEKGVSKLRWLAVQYLNSLESIMIAWRHNIADRTIIYEQFKYLFDPEIGSNVMASFRRVAGGRASFPAIEDFLDHLKKEKNTSGGLGPTGK